MGFRVLGLGFRVRDLPAVIWGLFLRPRPTLLHLQVLLRNLDYELQGSGLRV